MEILRLQGMLDGEALRGALTEIVRRHEALRTTFPVIDGRPFQQVHAPAAFSLSVVERHDLPREEEENEVAALASAEADRPFDLTCEPPFRVTLLSLRPDLNVLIITCITSCAMGGPWTPWCVSLVSCTAPSSKDGMANTHEMRKAACRFSHIRFRGWTPK
jgi:hypothetical protein